MVFVLATMLFSLNYVNYVAETRLSSGPVSSCSKLPFFSFVFARAMIGERTTLKNWLGATVAFVGVTIISLGGAVRGAPIYALASVVAAAVAAFANVYAKKHSHHAPLVTLPPSMLISGGVLAIAGLFLEPTNLGAAFSTRYLGALLYLAILGSGVSFFLMLWLLQRIPVWTIGISTLIFPVIAVAVGIIFGEHMDSRELLGSAIVVAGLAVALSPNLTAPRETRSDTA